MSRLSSVLLLLLLVSCGMNCSCADDACPSAGEGRVTLLSSGQEFVDSLLSRINGAKKSVYIEMYEFRSDSLGSIVMDALKSRASSGIRVELVLDGWGSRGQWNPDSLPCIGFSEWDSFRFPYVNHILSRNHRKVVVIDDSLYMVGSCNLADYYVEGLPELGTWHDMIVMYAKDSAETVPDGILEKWVSILDSAKDSVNIINPYIAPPALLESAVSSAVARGVKVRFLFGEKGDIPSYYGTSLSFMSRIGVESGLYPGGFHHTKAMSVDGKMLFIGSANMTRRALNRNLEENVLVSDMKAVAEYDSLFSVYYRQSYPLEPSAVTLSDRLLDFFSFLIID